MQKIIKIIIVIVIIALLVYGYFLEKNKNNVISNPTYSKQEQLEMKIEELEEKFFKLEEEKDDLSSQLEYLQEEYEYDEELISILKDQLKSYGIEPYEL